MIVFVFILLGLVFIPFRIHIKDFNTDYLSRDTTAAIKGILVFLVLVSHFTQNDYYPSNLLDISFLKFKAFYSQFPMVVALLYSSYGITEAIKAKGFSYIDKIPQNRILKTFILFALAQPLFMVANRLCGLTYSVSDTVLAFTGWRTIGADSWFMFDIFVLYAITWAAFRMYRENYIKASFIVSAGTLFLVVFLIKFNRDPYWYNTLIAFPLGIWLSLFKGKIEGFLFCNRHYYPVLAVIGGAFLFLWIGICRMSDSNSMLYEICAALWTFAVVLLSMKIELVNPILIFCGKNLFGFYMMHRIVLLLLPKSGYLVFPYIRFIVFYLISAVLAWGFTFISEKAASFVLKKFNT